MFEDFRKYLGTEGFKEDARLENIFGKKKKRRKKFKQVQSVSLCREWGQN